MEKKPPIAITMGDYLGIGPEIIVKALAKMYESLQFTPVIIGSYTIMKEAGKLCNIDLPLYSISDVADIEKTASPGISVLDTEGIPLERINLSPCDDRQSFGPTSLGGRAAVSYIKQGVHCALHGAVNAVVTAPISKEAIYLGGYLYPGHTELLAELTNTNDFAMMLAGGHLRVVLVTTHCAISAVSELISYDSVYRIIRLIHRWFSRYFGEIPAIAVSALNPHAGEGGIFGKEEEHAIIPAIEQAKKEGITVSGPYPADTLFSQAKDRNYDAIVTMYHDQGLIPLKMAAFGNSVNITLGLPIIRTSVDHGTAYDIAWQGKASASSMIEALKSACFLASKKNTA
ncbi:MAG: 4-hydroxythreonine-4-phosphate dehydrogenase PdxA [bacterium]